MIRTISNKIYEDDSEFEDFYIEYQNCTFRNFDMSAHDFIDVNFTNCSFTNMNSSQNKFSNVIFNNCAFNAIQFDEIDCNKLHFEVCSFEESTIQFNPNCIDIVFNNCEIYDNSSFKYINNCIMTKTKIFDGVILHLFNVGKPSEIFSECNIMDGVIFKKSKIFTEFFDDSTIIDNCIFDNCEIIKNILDYIKLYNCTLNNCSIHPIIDNRLSLMDKCGFENCEFNTCNIYNFQFQNSNFNDAKFVRCKLEKIKIIGSSLNKMSITESTVSQCKLYDNSCESMIISESSLKHMVILSCDMKFSNIQMNTFENMIFKNLNMSNAVMSNNAMSEEMIYQDIKFNNAKIEYTKFIDAIIIKIDISGASLIGSVFIDCYLNFVSVDSQTVVDNGNQYPISKGIDLTNSSIMAMKNDDYFTIEDSQTKKRKISSQITRNELLSNVSTTFKFLPKSSSSPSTFAVVTINGVKYMCKIFYGDIDNLFNKQYTLCGQNIGVTYEEKIYSQVVNSCLLKKSDNFVRYIGTMNINELLLTDSKEKHGFDIIKNHMEKDISNFDCFVMKNYITLLFTEYVQGSPVSEIKPIPDEKSLAEIIGQVILSCIVMYNCNLVHNDLHSNNVIIETLSSPTKFDYDVGIGTPLSITSIYKAYIFDWDFGYCEQLGENLKLADDVFPGRINKKDIIYDISMFICRINRFLNRGNKIVNYPQFNKFMNEFFPDIEKQLKLDPTMEQFCGLIYRGNTLHERYVIREVLKGNIDAGNFIVRLVENNYLKQVLS